MNPAGIFRILFGMAIGLAIPGCASLSPGAALRLATFDPLAADPAEIAVAARLPERLMLRSGDIIMRLRVDSDDPATRIDETFSLEVVNPQTAPSGLPAPSAGERIQIARIANADLARVKAAQAKALAYKASGRKGGGSLQLSIRGGCRTSNAESADLKVRLSMRTRADGDFFPLTSDIGLNEVADAGAIRNIPVCRDSQAGRKHE